MKKKKENLKDNEELVIFKINKGQTIDSNNASNADV